MRSQFHLAAFTMALLSSELALALALPLALALAPQIAHAQPADLPIPAATTTHYPRGVSVRHTDSGPVYVNAKGLTLYGMDMRTVVRWSPDPAQYCKEACTADWEPLLAPAGSTPNTSFPRGFGDRQRPATAPGQPAGQGAVTPAGATPPRPATPPAQAAPSPEDWMIIAGPQGPQWVYQGWHMVFVRKGDRPGSSAFDGADALTWNTLKFVPPVPQIIAPVNVATVLIDGQYALADKDGRALFTGKCSHDCAGWVPMAGGAASLGIGQWAVSRSGDAPQWTYRGKPVFVSQEDDPTQVPALATVLRP